MKKNKTILFLACLLALNVQCKKIRIKSRSDMNESSMGTNKGTSVEKSIFGWLPSWEKVEKYTLKNSKGMEVDIITYGGIITRWTAPDRNGNFGDIVLGYENLDSYVKASPYFGAIIGRYGNRIAEGEFSLDDRVYKLETNDGDNHLHGGDKGFDKVIWKVSGQDTSNGASLTLVYKSPDGEEGYPGNLDVKVTYALTNGNELDVHYEAVTDKKTIVNLTQHSYFNLSGDFSQTILDHEVYIDAEAYLPVDDGLIPTGELRSVVGTPFDFRKSKAIGDDIDQRDGQLILGQGYDHCWVLNPKKRERGTVASVYHPKTGRLLEVQTMEPGIQLYSGNFLDGTLPAKNGGFYNRRSGFCLETQHYPDSPNQSGFPSVVLRPGEKYETRTVYRFKTK